MSGNIGAPRASQEILRVDDVGGAGSDEALYRSIVKVVPEAKRALEALARARPALMTRVDNLTQRRFLDSLAEHVGRGLIRKGEGAAFAAFLMGLKERSFSWKMGGYSHATGACIALATEHPGLILDLVASSRAGRAYSVLGKRSYEGDGPHRLEPSPEFSDGFRMSSNWFSENAPCWETGLMRAVVDELKPRTLPEGAMAGRCDPVAVALSKLTGREIRYNWALNIRSGPDLVRAMSTQVDGFIAMGDVRIKILGREWNHYHFPVFYDFDHKTNTVGMQDFWTGHERVSVAGLAFEVGGSGGPSIYYEVCDGIEPFLTIDAQTTYAERKRAGEIEARDDRWGERVAELCRTGRPNAAKDTMSGSRRLKPGTSESPPPFDSSQSSSSATERLAPENYQAWPSRASLVRDAYSRRVSERSLPRKPAEVDLNAMLRIEAPHANDWSTWTKKVGRVDLYYDPNGGFGYTHAVGERRWSNGTVDEWGAWRVTEEVRRQVKKLHRPHAEQS